MWAGRLFLGMYAGTVIAFLLLPVIILLPMSFNDAMVFELFPSKPGIDQYVRLFSSGAWLDVFGRSLQIAVAVMVLATALGTLAALGIVQLSKRLRRFVEAAFLMPQIVPSIVTAVAAYFVFSALGLIGTLTAVVIAHVVVALPFVVLLIRSRLETLDPDLTLASASLGAGPVKTFLLIVAPQILVSIAAAALLAFHVSFDEVVLALFLTGVRTKTLPVKLWDSILFEISPILPAISTLVIMLPVVMLVVLYAIRKWTGREQHR
jgi:putative spermidine/putrescine transport system permease protein